MATGREPWGLVVNEAFNQGVPVVATRAVGAVMGGLVQDEVNGFVVPEKESDALAIALKRILDDPVLRDSLGENARRSVAEWDYRRNVMGYLQAINYVSDGGGT
jgi:glycosyltransferase involved in cell wall biosynthesis